MLSKKVSRHLAYKHHFINIVDSSDEDPEESRRAFLAIAAGDETNAAKFAAKTKRKIDRQLKNQPKKMPAVCQGMEYKGPVIITHLAAERENIFVVTNDVHSRHTNNGFSRADVGKFYCH